MTARPLEVTAAYVFGVGLPIVETLRRRTNFDDIPAYVDDYLMGALLVLAARAWSSGKPYAGRLLAGAWGVLCGGMYYSVVGQVASTALRDVSGLPHGLVITVKVATFAVAIACFVCAVRRPTEGAAA